MKPSYIAGAFGAMLGLGLLLGTLPARAQTSPTSLQAHPSMWHVKGQKGEVYLLGSVHILPPDVKWQTAKIDQASSRSDVFVFEVPNDAASLEQMRALVQAQGFLPANQSLRAQLHPDAQKDYDAALVSSGLPPGAVEHDRPWLADLQLALAQVGKMHFAPDSGVDSILMAQARQNHKQMRYLETIAFQFALLAPTDRTLELEEFEADLKDLRDFESETRQLLDAWSAGNQTELTRQFNDDLDDFPKVRKTLIDDRNANWLLQIEAMLKEKHVFFITVGAGHLAGSAGVPALLRKAGYKVDGP